MPFCSTSCCLCCQVLAGTILLGTQCLIFNAVVLLVLLSALADPDQCHFSSSELGGDFEFMDDANMCIAITISVLLVLICAMAVHGAYRQHVTRTIPFFCYQIFGFALNTRVAVTVLLPPNFPHKDDIMSMNPICLVLIIFLNSSDVLVYVTSSDPTTPPPRPPPPPPQISAVVYCDWIGSDCDVFVLVIQLCPTLATPWTVAH
ncbi:hypothetical protein MG293_007125 [Ovis ammon polii]|uniref:Uncharacterized protein n=1 Tax=Ovis ammon polii TaxID=230172 RepID=A0AAD4UE27_OVIAM|nr:hypothetical protein MG293_007125 [Ovis ammon polii]